jgi:hypothetical protein
VTARRQRRRAHRGELIGELQRELRPVAPPNAFVLLWRWRWELVIFAGIPAGLSALMIKFGPVWGLAFLGMAAIASAWPQARNWLIAHMRCILTAHRVRTGCAQAWIQTRYGKLPIILRTTPQPYGERVYIWCRAGISPEDFEAARDILRSACWARDMHVTSSTRYSHIVILEVVRYLPGSLC